MQPILFHYWKVSLIPISIYFQRFIIFIVSWFSIEKFSLVNWIWLFFLWRQFMFSFLSSNFKHLSHLKDKWIDLSAWIFIFLQVESFNTERALRKIKRHTSSAAVDISEPTQKGVGEISKNHMERLKLVSEESSVVQSNDMEVDAQSSEQDKTSRRDGDAKSFTGGPSSWYSLIPQTFVPCYDNLPAILISLESIFVSSKLIYQLGRAKHP